jgi:cytidine deaminase
MDLLKFLFDTARTAQANAYAPYSRFKVGAAVGTPGGNVYSGCNVENAAYPVGVCAEAAAISAMVCAGHERIADILVVADGELLVTPCGACRQRIAEFSFERTRIHIAGPEGLRRSFTMTELLPYGFGPGNLEDGAS